MNLNALEAIESKIYLTRGHKVMLDKDLGMLYQVPTKVLNQAVVRNLDRFPEDFSFQLTFEEATSLSNSASRSQIVTLKKGQNLKYRPRVFTEQGVAMLSSVLKSRRAIQVNIAIMRAFVRLRQFLIDHKELGAKFNELEERIGTQDAKIIAIMNAIRQLMKPGKLKTRPIGFLK